MISISCQLGFSVPWPLRGCHVVIIIITNSDLELVLILSISVGEDSPPDLESLWVWVRWPSVMLKKYIIWSFGLQQPPVALTLYLM